MKDKIRKEYLRRTRKLLKTKLSSRNLIKGINTWTVPLVRYSGPFLKWTRDELKQMDQRTRKLMTMHKALHPRDDVDRLYVTRKEGGRGLASIKDSVDASIQRLEDYIKKHKRGLITDIRNDTDHTINRDETINHIMSECSKWAQKEYKTRHDCVGMVIHWEMCKKLKFDHPNKWYLHNPAPVLENDTHKIWWDFNIQTDHLIPTRRTDLIIINKKRELVDFVVPADHRKKLKVILSINTSTLQGNWKTMDHEGDNHTNCNWCVWNSN